MRARRGKKRTVPEWLSDFPQQNERFGFMPRQGDLDSAMGGNTDIIAERAAREDALKGAVQYLREFGRTRPEDRAAIPYIAGYTDTPGDAQKAQGFARWLGKSPQQRYEDSALGQSESFSMEGPSPGRAVLSDMARGNSYWAGLARNVAYGQALPEANLPRMDAFEGQKWSDPERSSPMGELAERVGGAHVGPNTPPQGAQQTQRPLSWSEMDPETQQKIQMIAEKNNISVEEVLRHYYSAGGTGRRGGR